MKKYWVIAAPLVVAAFTMANAQTPEYVPVAKTPEPGKAPGLKVQLLTKPGEEPCRCQKHTGRKTIGSQNPTSLRIFKDGCKAA
jgi:hypothetical protein